MGRTIKEVRLLCPSIMKEGAAEKILDMHRQVEAMEEEKSQCFMRQCELEKKIADLKNQLFDIKNTYELVYEEGEVKEIVKGEAPMIVESNGTVHQ